MIALLGSSCPPFAITVRDLTYDKAIDLLVPRGPHEATLPIHQLPPADALLINAARPLDEMRPLAGLPFVFTRAGQDREQALDCLAAAAWYEAGDDPAGERSVIQVVLNRLRHPAFPKSVCAVVLQGSERSTGCQFTFTCDGALARRPGKAAWLRARALAAAALDGAVDAGVGRATHYHADYVYPYWAPSLIKLAKVGAHVFYRFPGGAGAWNALQLATGPEQAGPLSSVESAISSGAGLALGYDPDGLDGLTRALQPEMDQKALRLPGRAEPALGDGVVRFVVDQTAAPGRWAMEALSRCHQLPDCRVSAWASPRAMSASVAGGSSSPVFIFVRDQATHKELALWDCTLTPRTSPEQCLPKDRRAVLRLLAHQESMPKPSPQLARSVP
jgi:hypothetical protein